MPTRRFYVNGAPQQTITGALSNSDVTLAVAGTFSGWPTQFPFFATLDYGTISEEIVSVTNIAGTTATIVRGQGNTAAVSHPAGATFDFTFVAQDFDEANEHTTSDSGVHGVAGNVVGDTDAQTLTNKTLTSPVINGGTISGATFVNAVEEDGDLTHPALIGKATVAGGETLSLRDHTGTEKLGVDDAGNVTAAGTVTATGGVTTPAEVTAGSLSVAGVAGGVVPAGTVLASAAAVIPSGWLACDGSAVSRTTYAGLFSAMMASQSCSWPSSGPTSNPHTINVTVADSSKIAVGMKVTQPSGGGIAGIQADTVVGIVDATTIQVAVNGASTSAGSGPLDFSFYGAGNGTTTFNLPDLRVKFIQGADTTATTLGATGGAATHAHTLSDAGQAEVIAGGTSVVSRGVPSASWTSTQRVQGTNNTTELDETVGAALTGSTDSASSLPPYVVLRYIIKT